MPIEPGSFSFGVLASGLTVGLVSHFLAKSRSAQERKVAEFNKDALEFYKTFTDEIFVLNDALSSDSQDIQGSFHVFQNRTNSVIDTRKKAKISFERHLAASDREGFSAAWTKYAAWYDDCDSEKDKKEHTRMMFEHIKDLLKYAEPK